MRRTELVEIECAKPGFTCTQPCEKFGVHHKIPVLKEIYDAGHGLFISNMGLLFKPVTRRNYRTETRTHLFSHKTMERSAELVDVFQDGGFSTGVVGRMLDILGRDGYSVTANGISTKGVLLEGNPSTGRTIDVISSGGVNTLTRRTFQAGSSANDLNSVQDDLKFLNEETTSDSGLFGNFWSQNLIDTLEKTDILSELLSSATLLNPKIFSGRLGRSLATISKLILQRESRAVNRDAFYFTFGGFDSHSLVKDTLNSKLPEIDSALRAFYKEMSDQNLLNAVTMVVISEFGRTITPNSGLGSDHAWGGNYFMFGGEVNGTQILGEYPQSFEDTDATNIGRGRLLPTTSWDAMWYGIAQWFGIHNATDLKYVLPNNGNFGCNLFTDKDLYTTGNSTLPGCNDRQVGMNLGMFINEPRYLTGIEQRKVCEAAISVVTKAANVTSRCIIIDQQVIVTFDNGDRRLLSEIHNKRYLNSGNPTFTAEANLGLSYDDNELRTGTAIIEDPAIMTAEMNTEIASDTQNSNILSVSSLEADVTNAPSIAPSTSFMPSGHPSSSPSKEPSSTPSIMPSFFPIGDPSSDPSASPSSIPSLSVFPSEAPSNAPSLRPSSAPSTSRKPSSFPSAVPSMSLNPTGLPSGTPSSRPSANCLFKPDTCGFGMWSPYDCVCKCLSPYCPQDSNGACFQSFNCPAGYHENVFQGCTYDCPHFKYINTCAQGEVIPSGVLAIYQFKTNCCAEEFPEDVSGCNERTATYSPFNVQLKFSGSLILSNLGCPSSSIDINKGAEVLGKAAFSNVCDTVPGLQCNAVDKVMVTHFCGVESGVELLHNEVRVLQASNILTDIANFTFVFNTVSATDARAIAMALEGHLQGSNLDALLVSIKNDIIASTEFSSFQSIGAVGYRFLSALLVGLGLYYPDWGNLETCINDGGQPVYMNANPLQWLNSNVEDCCQRYYHWQVNDCLRTSMQSNQVTSSTSEDTLAGLFYPDWTNSGLCVNDGNAPSYMKNAPTTWMHSEVEACCTQHFYWGDKYGTCVGGSSQSESSSTQHDHWYVNWENFECVQNCVGPSPCGGIRKSWQHLHDSARKCCDAHLHWVTTGNCSS